MKKASWVMLFVQGLLILVFSLLSAMNAYWRNWGIGPTTLTRIEALAPGTEVALRGSRATAAAFGVGFAVLFLTIVLGPYRRGEVWAWWALLGGMLSFAVVALLRVPLLGTTLGTTPAVVPLVVVLVALLLDLGRLRAPNR